MTNQPWVFIRPVNSHRGGLPMKPVIAVLLNVVARILKRPDGYSRITDLRTNDVRKRREIDDVTH
jgi:hypothetical protein